MPTEERFITFSLEEIYKAIKIKALEESLEVPPDGELKSVDMEEGNGGDDAQIFLTIVRKADDQEERLKYVRKFFALALVFYCQGKGIPLPRSGAKTLAILDDKVVMKIVMK